MPDKTILFTDARHICVGDLGWVSPEGGKLELNDPAGEPVEARAALGMMPRGIRFVSQPGSKIYDEQITGPVGRRIVYDGGIYRSWRLTVKYPPGKDLGCASTSPHLGASMRYSESSDGFHWEEKAQCPIDAAGQTMFDGFTFFIDPKGKPEERYKAVYCSNTPKEGAAAEVYEQFEKLHPRCRDNRMVKDGPSTMFMHALVSPDGIDWHRTPRPLMVHLSDTDTSITYNEWLGRYIMYTRLYPNRRRVIGWAEAEDFFHWSPVQPLIWPGLEDIQNDIYLNAYSTYPGLPEYHLMFPMIYQRYTQRSEIHLYSSPNGLQWNRVPGQAVLEPGTNEDRSYEFMTAGKDLVPLGSDRVAVTYGESRFPHKYPRWPAIRKTRGSRSWAWWPKGRLCAIKADEEGEFWTNPITPAGRQITLNVHTHRAGEVRVEVVGTDGRSIKQCDPIIGDGFSLPVNWQGDVDIGAPEGKSVRLHFKMRAAELFGLEWV